MIVRIFKGVEDGVVKVRVQTEDWSELERQAMVQMGEPKIDLGGLICPAPADVASGSGSSGSSGDGCATLDDVYARVMTESPFTRKFDSRDYGLDGARAMANGWAIEMVARIGDAVGELREFRQGVTTEEVVEI